MLADPQMPVTSTLLDQAHNALERKRFAMKGLHHPGGARRRFSRGSRTCITWSRISVGLSMLANVVWKWKADEYLPADWFLNLQILTSGGFR